MKVLGPTFLDGRPFLDPTAMDIETREWQGLFIERIQLCAGAYWKTFRWFHRDGVPAFEVNGEIRYQLHSHPGGDCVGFPTVGRFNDREEAEAATAFLNMTLARPEGN